jgi:hypothetical protein
MDYADTLRQMRTEIAETQARIVTLRKVEEQLQRLVGEQSLLPECVNLKGRTILEAAEILLETVDRPLTSQEVADALLAGGLPLKRKNPAGSIYQTLKYSSKRFKRPAGNAGWGLSHWPDEKWGEPVPVQG